jgi:hypothetical protein
MIQPDRFMFAAKMVADNSPRKAGVSQALLMFCRHEPGSQVLRQDLALDVFWRHKSACLEEVPQAQKKSGAPKRAALS